MIYTPGGTVEADDYNILVSNINDIFGVGFGDSGYGGFSLNVPFGNDLAEKAIGDDIDNEEWLNIRNAFDDCAEHQGTTLTDGLPSENDIEEGDLASFFPRLNSSQNIFDLTDGRLNQNNSFTPTIVNAGIDSVRTTDWKSFIQHEFLVTFEDSDHARYFFNTGGTIRISASRTGGDITTQNNAWNEIIDGNDLVFTHEHYYNLTGSAEELRPQIAPLFGPYSTGVSVYNNASTNVWTMLGQRDDSPGPNDGNGAIIRIFSNFLDGNTNLPDNVNGIFTSTIQESKFTDVFNITSPIYRTVTNLVEGF